MPQFLKLQPPFEARLKLLENLPQFTSEREEIDTLSALKRVLACDFYAPHPLPEFPRSTVDGYAVKSADTHGASESLPSILTFSGEAPMGQTVVQSVRPGQAILIHTGGMLPPGADAVVMLEQTQLNNGADLEIFRSVSLNENVILIGEDVHTNDLVIPAGRIIRPVEIGGLMSFGATRVEVNKRPIVGILSSGDEIVEPATQPQPGQVRDINTTTMSALVIESGGDPRPYPIIPDNEETLSQAVMKAYNECDMVLITAGSSASTRDLTADVIKKLGVPGVLAHGVNVRPGKPTILAVCDGKPVIGLPGNPVSALVIADLFVRPVIRKLLNVSDAVFHPGITARLTANVSSAAGREDWVPVILSSGSDGYSAEPIFFKSNLIFNLVRANALLHIEADVTGVLAGAMVQVELL
ncbi:MAG: molybdopterin molybdenumtransferase MoeA [Anaerolinea sp.]|nr:molybdopterin molybdenumtransferase MoeA [Anaerolinea sp.]